MACKTICRLCDKLIVSTGLSIAGTGELLVNIPAGSYAEGEKYCIVIAQTIPASATINARVLITIGNGSQSYPLITKNGRNVTASMINTRTRYSTTVVTNATGGAFRLMGCLPKNDSLRALDGSN